MQMKFPLLAALLGLLLATCPAYAQLDTQVELATAWKATLAKHIAGNKLLPIEGRGQAGSAKVSFVINRSGRLISRTLDAGTGSRQVDAALLAIFDRAQPFPEPPSGLTEEAFAFNVPLVFAGLLMLAVEGIAMYALMAWIEKRMTGWAHRSSMSH